MKKAFVTVLALFILSLNGLLAQCSNSGQTPSTAFPVCGTANFFQGNVPNCTNNRIFVPGCSNAPFACPYEDINPFWYRFTCFTSGSLGFVIDPIKSSDDYDWQIFDITGRNPNDVYTNNSASMVIAANWSARDGQTGTRNGERGLVECCTNNLTNPPNFSKMPNIVAGRTYLLMVSNFSSSQQGYKLSFGGGTAVITDPKLPLMQSVKPNCGGDELRLKLNKKMRCSSISLNGSDVVGFPGGITATGIRTNCTNGFETDSVIITLSAPLPPGNYTLRLKNGNDGNTFLDICDRSIPLTDQLSFEYTIPQPTKLDSIVPVQCAPNAVRFVFKKLIKCSSIAANGSDFDITGSYPVTVTGAAGTCNADGLTGDITVTFNRALQAQGDFTVRLRPGFDGNTIIDECNQITPPSQLSFSVKDTVNADFSYNIRYGCLADTVDYSHPGGNEINSWFWTFETGGGRTNANEQVIYKSFGHKTTSLIVTNGFCSDTTIQTIRLNNFIKADFEVDAFNCPAEPVLIKALPTSERPLTYLWSFGDGQTSLDSQPAPHFYPVSLNDQKYTIRYTITNDLPCSSTAEKIITVVKTCRIDVPSAFTPNGDGLNDLFGPLNAIKAEGFLFRIYNRWGVLLFESKNWLQMWDGKYKGIEQEPTTYVWTLSYVERDTRKSFIRKGTFVLIR